MMGYILIALAAFFNAVMDTVEYEAAFNKSIFKKLNQRFWLKSVSWQYAYKIFNYKIDCWHLCKSLLVICIALLPCVEFKGSWWVIVLNIGIVWNTVFVLFYHFMFRIK